MNGVNYLLLLTGKSDKGGSEASVRGFAKLESAQAAMLQSYREYAAVLGIPVNGRVCNQYTTKTKNTIYLSHFGDHFRWEIIKAVPEDGDHDDTFTEGSGKPKQWMSNYTVTIEEHIAQDFSVCASDICDAICFAESEYKRGKFVVLPSTPNVRLIMARNDETGETTEWKEF